MVLFELHENSLLYMDREEWERALILLQKAQVLIEVSPSISSSANEPREFQEGQANNRHYLPQHSSLPSNARLFKRSSNLPGDCCPEPRNLEFDA